MRIKKRKRNEYIQAEDVWVRDFTKRNVAPKCITKLTSVEDQGLLISNELQNKTLNLPRISDESIGATDVVIVSDGYDFENRHKFLSKLDPRVVILAVNGALKKWKLYRPGLSPENMRTINAYVFNNPYKEGSSYIPPKDAQYFPTCIASSRANHEFLKKYHGKKYLYEPTPEHGFGFSKLERYLIDDYRNPICAALGIAYQFGVLKLMFLCCDDSFEDERDTAIKLENGLWTYPHHLKNQAILNTMMYFLKSQEDREVRIADYSSGVKYTNAEYIDCDEDAVRFFNATQEEELNV